MSPPIIVHYHIFKNAGTSVDAILKSSFGGAWSSFEGAHPHDIQSADSLAAFLAAHPELKSVSSHLARPPLPSTSCLPIVFLRHPILRARSVYNFTRQDPSQPFHEIAQEHGFSSYIRWAVEGGRGGVVIRDYQVIHLSPASFRGHILDVSATDADLEYARNLVRDWGGVGIVEEFSRSASFYQTKYQPLMPDLEFEVMWRNRTQTEMGTPEQAIAEIQTELGSALYDALYGQNRRDLALYEEAAALLHQNPILRPFQ